MPSVFTTTATWTGFSGAPGYTKFHWIDLATTASYTAATDGMRAFFFQLAAFFPTGTQIQVAQTLQEYDAATSRLLSEHSAASIPPVVIGTATAAPYAGGSGICVSWKTGSIYNGRRVQGRSFLVPTAASVFESNGTLAAGTITAVQTAGDALINIALADFAVWAKTWQHNAPPLPPTQVGGQGFSVQNCICRDAASQLRSRRN